MLPAVDAVSIVMVEVPPIFRMLVAPCVNVPAPVNAVVTVNVLLFVNVPVTATFGIEVVVAPLSIFEAPVKVWVPVPLVNEVALFVKLPCILKVQLLLLVQLVPEFRVTSPFNVIVLADPGLKFIVPVIFVVKFIVVVRPADNEPPLFIVKYPKLSDLVEFNVPFIVTEPVTVHVFDDDVMVCPTCKIKMSAAVVKLDGLEPVAFVFVHQLVNDVGSVVFFE